MRSVMYVVLHRNHEKPSLSSHLSMSSRTKSWFLEHQNNLFSITSQSWWLKRHSIYSPDAAWDQWCKSFHIKTMRTHRCLPICPCRRAPSRAFWNTKTTCSPSILGVDGWNDILSTHPMPYKISDVSRFTSKPRECIVVCQFVHIVTHQVVLAENQNNSFSINSWRWWLKRHSINSPDDVQD